MKTARRDHALRLATIPFVEDIVQGLVDQGMSYEKACRTVRYAAHVLEVTKGK